MIAQVWHGWTTRENADTYERHLLDEVLPGIAAKGIPGFWGGFVLRTERESETEFVTLLFFESFDALRRFAGVDYRAAYVPETARRLLSRFDERVEHYENVIPFPVSPRKP
jgi:heme-degrading monooxygenase HmoA